jgi:hypothetical protein
MGLQVMVTIMMPSCHIDIEPHFHVIGNFLNGDTADYPELSRALSPSPQVKGKFKVVPVHAIKTGRGVDEYPHSLLTSALYGDE